MKIDAEQFMAIAEEVLGSGRELRTRVTGGSMGASIADGSVVCFEPASQRGVRRGDIVLIRSAMGRAVCHRVFALRHGVDGPEIQTWGDGAIQPDAPVPLGNVLGRLKSIEGPGRNPLTASARLHAHARFYWRRLRRLIRGRPPASTPPR